MKRNSSPARNPGRAEWQRSSTSVLSNRDRWDGCAPPRECFNWASRPYDVTRLGLGDPIRNVPQAEADEDPRLARMRVEAVLLLAKTPLNPRKLAQLAHLADATEARTLVRQLNHVYDTLGRALRVEHVAGGYRLLTRPELAPWLARLGHVPAPLRLSTPTLETLAVIAYRQPVSRANAEAIRGVACGELLRQLMERELIRIVGRGEELGRPYLYGTTKRFLQLFGLPNVDALPSIQWQTLREDPIPEDSVSTLDDLSTSTKEPVVSTTVAPVLAETDFEVQGAIECVATPTHAPTDASQPAAIDDDDFYDEDDDDAEEGSDWEDDDWDDDDPDELDDDDDDEVASKDDDDLEEEDWKEVDDDEDGDDDWEDDDDKLDDDDDDDDWDDDELDDDDDEAWD
ncbi:MAG: SMC-Scp complex subunit ScpB [Rubripirellula sp.]